MPAPSTTEEFLDLVRKSGVVEDKRLDGQLQKVQAGGPLPSDPRQLAGILVRDGVLTQFQAEQFLQGKWRRFTIGKYKVLERLGQGGMGSVFLCEHKFMRRRTAVKVLPTAKAEDPQSLDRFYREARAVAALDHPNIVRAYDIDQDDKLHFLVMEYVDGASLQDVIKRGGPMDVTRAAHYIRQAAVGLQHAHEAAGLVHRDIKPANLLIDRQGVVKILDMGLARFFHDEEDILTKKYDDAVLGTADYLAPEQAIDSHGVDIRADIYSLGATFYFLLTGSPPFDKGTVAQKLIWHQSRMPTPIRTVRPEVPEGLAAVVTRMMAKDPAQRYPSPAAVVEALAPWTQTSIPPPPEREMPRLSPAAQGPGSHPDLRPAGGSSTANGPATPPSQPANPTPPPAARPAPATAPRGTSPAAPRPAAVRPPPTPPPRANGTAPGRPGLGQAAAAAWGAVTLPAERPAPTPRPRPTLAAPATRPQPVKARERTDRQPVRAPARRLALVRKYWWVGALAALALATVAVLALRRDGPAAQAPPAEPRVLKVGGSAAYKTVREALPEARPGDCIVVQDDVEEPLRLEGRDGNGVSIEAAPGKRIVWTCPADEVDGPFFLLAGVKGVHLKGFVIDGGNKVGNLIQLRGQCPGVVLEDMEWKGFTRAALAIRACKGGRGKDAVRVTRVRAVTPADHPADYAVIFEHTELRPTEYVTVRDSRFEGPYKVAAVDINAPLSGAEFVGNRVYQAAAGLRYEARIPSYLIQLTVAQNTFCDVKVGLDFQGVPTPDDGSLVAVNANLFAGVQRLLQLPEARPIDDAALAKVFHMPTNNFSDPEHPDSRLPALKASVRLVTTPGTDAFLRYPKDSPLSTAGQDRTPVGAGPIE
jgi:serine/threonine protein kinase